MERDAELAESKKRSSISTHALTWSATGWQTKKEQSETNFNSRAHVERDVYQHFFKHQDDDFNSRAHVERDGVAINQSAMLSAQISTHALTWSAT